MGGNPANKKKSGSTSFQISGSHFRRSIRSRGFATFRVILFRKDQP